ncbi:MAG: hypothetical protein RLZZ628_1218 [Bacteroidota bacterium]|jgi:hypothetical protein
MTNDTTPKKTTLTADEINLHQIDDKIFKATMQNKEADQKIFFDWINSIRERFVMTLQMEDSEMDKISLLQEFQNAYKDLKRTVSDLASFEALLGNKLKTDRLEHSISSTKIELVNSQQGKTPLINWKDHYSFILVGGQSLDRGFTVEGLTVTYMPRSVGVGTVDTIQQRARFFGRILKKEPA